MKKLLSILFILSVIVVPVQLGKATAATAAPSNLTAVGGNAFVSLKWQGGGESLYYIKRATKAGGPYETVGTMSGMYTYTDWKATNGVTYYYVVTCGYSSENESGPSNEVSVTPHLPTAPTNVKAVAGSAKATLTWDAQPGAQYYNVYKSTKSGGPYSTVITQVAAATYTETALTNGTKYYYVIKAYSNGALSPNSTEVAVTPTK